MPWCAGCSNEVEATSTCPFCGAAVLESREAQPERAMAGLASPALVALGLISGALQLVGGVCLTSDGESALLPQSGHGISALLLFADMIVVAAPVAAILALILPRSLPHARAAVLIAAGWAASLIAALLCVAFSPRTVSVGILPLGPMLVAIPFTVYWTVFAVRRTRDRFGESAAVGWMALLMFVAYVVIAFHSSIR